MILRLCPCYSSLDPSLYSVLFLIEGSFKHCKILSSSG
ncbi:unnamed protein product [Arabidopsis halleri]